MMLEVQIERDSGRNGMTRWKRWGKRIAMAPFGLFLVLILYNLVFCGQLQAAKVPPGLGQRCESCHDGYAFQNQFPESVHGNNGCTSCHAGIKDLSRHINGQYKPVSVSCKS